MAAVVVVGAQWGDEGKGKVVDFYTEFADWVVRFGGGPNAGHTLVVNQEKMVVRLIPSGILRPQTVCVLAQGMVIDPTTLAMELDELSRRRLLNDRSLMVSDRAHMILPYHILIDQLREQREGALGTTKRGVGPCYEDKVARRGIVLGDMRYLSTLEQKIQSALLHWHPVIAALGGESPGLDEMMAPLTTLAKRLVPLLEDTSYLVSQALRNGKHVLFEGAQGTLLDIDHGTYPYVTSSHATAGGACTGVGIGPSQIDTVIGLAKAYCTRVGEGPFPTELHDERGEKLRSRGGEFGSVTGRPRRIGWLDLPALRYAARINGLDGLALSKLDVLSGLPDIKVCTEYVTKHGYKREISPQEWDDAEPVYTTLPGWQEPLCSARTKSDLPVHAEGYVRFVEEQVGCPLVFLSVGSERGESIVLSNPFVS